jgi:predicted MFS family arabinose efflux permease
MTSQPALNALNFFMADVRDGLGPFLGVYLQSEKWSPSQIGLVMTIGGLVGVAATAPLGALVDRIRAKRALIVVSAVAIVLASIIVVFAPGFIVTAVSQSISGIAGAAIVPAIAGITLGLVKQSGYAHQTGRNEAFNHAGNVVAAILAGFFGYIFGIGAVFGVMAMMAAASVVATCFIDPKKIDHRAARGLSEQESEAASGWSTLVRSKPLLILAATLLLFHLGNGAMLPLLGQALVANGAGDPSAFTGATVVVAQLTMVPMAILAARLAETRGYWIVFVLALVALPIRGVIAAVVTGPLGLGPVQMLDGVGAGLLGVAVPGLVARILAGTGHVNAGLGAVMTMQGAGAALSPALGGYVAEKLGYPASFLVLGAVAVVALVLWMVAQPMTAQFSGKPA